LASLRHTFFDALLIIVSCAGLADTIAADQTVTVTTTVTGNVGDSTYVIALEFLLLLVLIVAVVVVILLVRLYRKTRF
jgi:hypothetical protein